MEMSKAFADRHG